MAERRIYQPPPLPFLADGGEMGALMRATNWSDTPIGPAGSWSQSLRMMVSLLLANRFPLLLWWGPQYISIYNDAYRPILGQKHPRSIGQPVSECWAEIWHILKPLIDTPFNGGPATWMDDIPLEINRNGFVEETHFTIAYSPVPDDTAPRGIGGVLATVHEITEKIVGERRLAVLRRSRRARRGSENRQGSLRACHRNSGRPQQGRAFCARLPDRRGRAAWPPYLRRRDLDRPRFQPDSGRSRSGFRTAPVLALGRGRAQRRDAGGRRSRGSLRWRSARSLGRPARYRRSGPAALEPRAKARRRSGGRGQLEARPRRALSKLSGAGGGADRDRDRQRPRLRGRAPAGRGPGRNRPGQDRVFLECEPRVPHSADPAAEPARGPAAARRS